MQYVLLLLPYNTEEESDAPESFAEILLLWTSQRHAPAEIGISRRHHNLLELHRAAMESASALDSQPVGGSAGRSIYQSGSEAEPVSVMVSWDREEEFLSKGTTFHTLRREQKSRKHNMRCLFPLFFA